MFDISTFPRDEKKNYIPLFCIWCILTMTLAMFILFLLIFILSYSALSIHCCREKPNV
jgi:hypothetical protein